LLLLYVILAVVRPLRYLVRDTDSCGHVYCSLSRAQEAPAPAPAPAPPTFTATPAPTPKPILDLRTISLGSFEIVPLSQLYSSLSLDPLSSSSPELSLDPLSSSLPESSSDPSSPSESSSSLAPLTLRLYRFLEYSTLDEPLLYQPLPLTCLLNYVKHLPPALL
jgi:hypothetical protein